ncbi:MAG: class I SAM-dependent methyltransferase [Halioglobus sp.]
MSDKNDKAKNYIPSSQGKGLDKKPGDKHYRAYIGPPRHYDLISAMTFNLLTCLGLRQNHKVLDIGCGSLRVGRLLIPYLDKGSYYGVEPNEWLVRDGIANELGNEIVEMKRPTFVFGESLRSLEDKPVFDFAFAQSVFSHTGIDLLRDWLTELAPVIATSGAVLATFLFAEHDSEEIGWVYPGVVSYRESTLERLAEELGFSFRALNWSHPRQVWVILYREEFDTDLINGGNVHWNQFMKLEMVRDIDVRRRLDSGKN